MENAASRASPRDELDEARDGGAPTTLHTQLSARRLRVVARESYSYREAMAVSMAAAAK